MDVLGESVLKKGEVWRVVQVCSSSWEPDMFFFYYFRMRGSGSERVYWLCLELWSAGWHVGGAADSYQDFTTKIIILKRSGLFLFFFVLMIQNVKAVIYVFKIYFLVFVPLAGRGKHLPPAPNFFFSFLFSFLFWSFLVCLFSKTQQNVSSRCRIWISRMISHTSCLATEFNDIEKWASFFFVSISKSGSRGSLYVRAHPLQTLYVFIHSIIFLCFLFTCVVRARELFFQCNHEDMAVLLV